MRRVVSIIANPISGGGRGARLAPALARALEARGIETDLHFTTCAGDARARAQQITPGERTGVAVVGGDGTVNEVLNGLPDPTLPLGVLPLGTANVLACELRLPRDPAQAAELFDRGREVRAAIGLANARRFLLFCGVGLDARIVARLEKVREGTLGKHKWVGPIAHVVRHWPNDALRLETDAGETLDGCSEVLVTRVRNYGGLLAMPGGMDIEDRLLHVIAFRQRTRTAYVAAAWRAFRGTLRPGRDVEVLQARAVRIDAEAPVPCQVDGDGHGASPVEITLDARQARLVAAAL